MDEEQPHVAEHADAPAVRPAAPSADAVYQALSARRMTFDQMMWQAPALSLAAQAVFVTVAVDADNGLPIRVLALLLAIGSGLLTMQLHAKQRFHEQVDTYYLRAWEQAADVRPVHGFAPHDPPVESDGSGKAIALGLRAGRWVRLSSYRLWLWGMRISVLVMLGLLIWVLASGGG